LIDNSNKEKEEEAIEKIEKVLSISEKYLSEIEKKAAFATINYLKAKNLI